MSTKKTSAKNQKGGWSDTLLNLALELIVEVGARVGIHAVDRFFEPAPPRIVDPAPPVSEPLPKSQNTKRKAKKAKIIKMPTPWWKVLKIPETSTKSEIKRAYREQMMLTHPDKVAHLSKKLQRAAELEAKKLNQAYENAMNYCDRSRH